MKKHETKMPRMEDILNLPVQDPPCAKFSSVDINWVKVEGGRQGGDDIAVIPFARVRDFLKGESSNSECPASFRIESRRKRSEGSISRPRVDGYLEYTLYWCSYGPEDYRECESSVGESSNVKPARGKGSRPGRCHMMRGCLCHFTVKRLYTRPLVALIIYNQRKHVDKTGAPCHGILDRDAVGTRAMYAPRISEELRQKVMFMLYAGVSLDNIIQHHMEVVQEHGGPHNRDDFLTRNDVRNIERVICNSSHELHADDAYSVKMWVQRHQKHVFYFQDKSGFEPFILGIQTDWQLHQMQRYAHNGSIACHSNFGLKKLKYPIFTLLVFDSSWNAIPVAWVITSSFPGQDVHKCFNSLAEKIWSRDPRWNPTAFLVDNASFQVPVIREAFKCQVLFSIWHVRRAWMRSLLTKCCNTVVLREMLKHLGLILHSRSSPNFLDLVQEFMEVFVDQSDFMEYFKVRWLPCIESWVNGIKMLPLAGPEPNAAIESYHLRLKSKLFDQQYANFWPRIDWLIHTLTTEFHSLYWFHQYTVDTGHFATLGDGFLSINACYQAMNIPDVDVILDLQNLQLAKIISQSDRSLAYTVWNPASEFAFCDCHGSSLGNLCKHVIKMAIMFRTQNIGRPLFAARLYRQILLSLLQKPPGDPLVLEHAVLHATRLQQDIKSLEGLSNSGLLQPLPPEMNPQIADAILFPRSH